MLIGFIVGLIIFSMWTALQLSGVYEKVEECKQRGIPAKVNIYWPIILMRLIIVTGISSLIGHFV